jgi:glycosyltransferase involved in cell wall biosynthesis
MTRVLLVCPEPLGHRQPAGVGIRFIEMAKVLTADGHHVTTLSPDDGGLAPEIIARATEEYDVVVVQGHAANALFAHGKPLPTVVDLYDPFIVENLHYYGERGAEVFHHDHATLISSLARGDFFLCASDAQRLFYLGLLLGVGRLSPPIFESDPHLDSLIRVAPFGVQAPRVAPAIPPAVTHDLLFGGIYDWYDPILAIDAVAIAREQIGDINLTFMQHPNPDLTPQGKAAEALEYVTKRGYKDFVHFENWVAYDDRGEFYERFASSLLTFRQSIETDLSMRTRVFDSLWGSLPIITSSAPGTDEILARYGAGIVIEVDDAPAFARAIVGLLHNEQRLCEMREGAIRFVVDHQWSRVLEPLREFCMQPRVVKEKDAFAVRPPSMLDRLKRRIGGAF